MSLFHVRASVFAALFLAAAGTSSAAPRVYLLPAKAQARLAQTRPQPAIFQATPFELNPFIFSSPEEARRALTSPDILMRRSGIEWLGRATGTDGWSSGPPDYLARNIAWLRQHVDVVAPLTQAVKDMPAVYSQQAARLLAIIGPPAQSAVSTVCAALASTDYGDGKPQDGDDFVARRDLLSSLVQLCGGPDALTSTLVTSMRDREPQTRRAAAAAVRFCVDPTYRSFITPSRERLPVLSQEQSQQRNKQFHQQIFPALAACVNDSVTAVRLDALASLEWLTYDSADAPWQAVEPALARAVASTNPNVRLAALKVLAYMPADASPLAKSLRAGLHGDKDEQNYALAAICHSAQTDRTVTIAAFLPDLASSDLLKRRQAAHDIQLAAIPLTTGNFWPGPYPLANWWNDIRLFTVFNPDVAKQREAAAEAAQPILLAAIAKSASDPDHAVRASAASSLEQIGNWTYSTLGIGFTPNPAVAARPEVENALAQAAASLQSTEPALAQRLQDLQAKVTNGPGVAE